MVRRRSVTQTIPAALRELDSYLSFTSVATAAEGQAVPDNEVTYTFITKSKQRVGCTREQLEGKSEGGTEWPVPGEYEIDIVDSNDNSTLADGPWRCCHFDKDSLAKSDDGDGSPGGRLLSGLLEENRIQLRNQRGLIDSAERREALARTNLNAQIDVCGQLQREKNNALLERDRAVADREFAAGKQKEAEEALALLVDQMAHLKPQMEYAVDHMISRASVALGLTTQGDDAANETASESATEESDPAPPGIEDPQAVLENVFRGTICNYVVCRQLVEAGLLKWDDVRKAIWLASGIDLGEVPDWDKFIEAFGNSEEPQAGAA